MQRIEAADELLAWVQANSAETPDVFGSDEVRAYVALSRFLALDGSSYYAECRLAEPRQLDLLVSFNRYRSDLALLATRIASCWELANNEAKQAWALTRDFVQRWMMRGEMLHEAVSAIWLEFDDVRRFADEQAPSVSACVVPNYGRDFRPADRLVRHHKAEIMASVYRALVGTVTDDDTADLLRSCTHALPDGADFIHVSLMAARHPRAVKVYGVVPRSQLAGYLRTVGWCGSFVMLHTVLHRLAIPELCGDHIYFDLNLCNMHLPGQSTLGIAFSQQQVGPDVRRRTLFQHLTDEGQCTSQHAAVLGSWATLAPEPSASNRHRRVSRYLDLKTVFGAGAGPHTKAYLGFRIESNPFVIGF